MPLAIIEFDYDARNDVITWGSGTNVKKEALSGVLEGYIRTQIGAGEDLSEPIDRDVYHIRMDLDLSDDSFRVSHNCGNEALCLGITLQALRETEKF